MTYDVAALRAGEFPWADGEGVTYFDHASTGPLPWRARAVQRDFSDRRAEPFRLKADDLFPTLQRARDAAGRMVGAPPGSVALVTNTSHGVNIAARTLPFRSGDVILSTRGEFPANVYPWLAATQARGAEFRMLPLAGDRPDEAALMRAIEGEPRVKGVAISWVSFWNGHRFDVEAIGAACRKRGIWFFVDAIQGVGACELDVVRAHVDVLSCGAQKWLLSPWGTGFAYVRPDLIASLEPAEVGWMAQPATSDFTRFLEYDPTWFDDARRFEVVTLDFVNFATMTASLSLLDELGVPAIAAHVQSLVRQAEAFGDTHPGIALVSPREPAHRAGVIALRPRDVAAASERLKAAKVFHSVREGCIRLAPHCYNTAAEMDRAMGLIGGA